VQAAIDVHDRLHLAREGPRLVVREAAGEGEAARDVFVFVELRKIGGVRDKAMNQSRPCDVLPTLTSLIRFEAAASLRK
jgi:hypothetical protein